MTMRELMKKLFGTDNLDQEVQVDEPKTKEEPAKVESKEPIKVNINTSTETKEQPKETKSEPVKQEPAKEEEVVDMNIFELGWYDENTGKIDLNKIKNDEVRSAIDTLSKRHIQAMQARDIQDAITSELGNYSLTVSTDTLKKMLDTSSVKIGDDGKVIGVKDAIENIKKSEPGLFKDKAKESNPLNEGFSPVEKKVTGYSKSITTGQILASMREER